VNQPVPSSADETPAAAQVSRPADVLSRYRQAGRASADAASSPGIRVEGDIDPTANGAAFFDVDNTIMRGASLFHFAVGLARRHHFSGREILGFGIKQVKFVLSGSEDLEDMASATEAALSFVEGRSVAELSHLGEEVFDDTMVDKLIPGTLALAQGHLDAGQQVWLVTATPVELATVIARRLGLTGALGTVAEVRNGIYTGHLDGPPLHGLAKAEAVRAIAEREGLDLSQCSAYSDSSNDIPMLSIVGRPVAVNPDSTLLAHARSNDWQVRDFRRRQQVKRYALPAATGAGGLALGMAIGYLGSRPCRA
jgi:HAD superfamily hydrolase (TIGR01490 family)